MIEQFGWSLIPMALIAIVVLIIGGIGYLGYFIGKKKK